MWPQEERVQPYRKFDIYQSQIKLLDHHLRYILSDEVTLHHEVLHCMAFIAIIVVAAGSGGSAFEETPPSSIKKRWTAYCSGMKTMRVLMALQLE